MLVNTIEGPQKTSSSKTTPSYRETLFWILTLSPMDDVPRDEYVLPQVAAASDPRAAHDMTKMPILLSARSRTASRQLPWDGRSKRWS